MAAIGHDFAFERERVDGCAQEHRHRVGDVDPIVHRFAGQRLAQDDRVGKPVPAVVEGDPDGVVAEEPREVAVLAELAGITRVAIAAGIRPRRRRRGAPGRVRRAELAGAPGMARAERAGVPLAVPEARAGRHVAAVFQHRVGRDRVARTGVPRQDPLAQVQVGDRLGGRRGRIPDLLGVVEAVVEVLEFELGKELDVPGVGPAERPGRRAATGGGGGVVGVAVADRPRQAPLDRVIRLQPERDLLDVVAALDAPGRFAGSLHGRQQQRHQGRDDRDHDQHFDEREPVSARLGVVVSCHGASPNLIVPAVAPAARHGRAACSPRGRVAPGSGWLRRSW